MIKHPDSNSPSGFRYELETSDVSAGRSVAFLTGPISGTMSLPDGSAYDVSEEVIAVAPEHVHELHRAIHKAHHAAGRFLDAPLPSE
jgi:hypothetical protein